MIAINVSSLNMASVWVDADGYLLVATDETPKPLPEGAKLSQQVLVSDDGRLLISPY